MIRRRYIDAATGQLHLRESAAAPGTPLACLHATAYSSRSFIPLLTALDGRRHVLAIDTPGYGESDAPSQPLTIAGYASAIASALPDRVDLFGYHTGAAIAVELAIAHPDRVGRLTMMGVPLFQALDFEAWRARLAARHHLGPDLDQFAERWDFLVTNRPAGLSLRRGFENFVDELKAWPDGWRSHAALFDLDFASRLPLIRVPVTILNPPGHLAEPSRAAAALMLDCAIIELPHLTGAAIEIHAATLADHLLESRSAPPRQDPVPVEIMRK